MRVICFLICVGVISALLPAPAAAQSANKKSPPLYSDGPYFFYEEGQMVSRWMVDNELRVDTVRSGQPVKVYPGVSSAFDPDYLHLESTFTPDPQIAFKKVERVAAVSDIHGQYDLLIKLLKAHNIISPSNDWAFGIGHLVILGDIFDRGDGVVDLLWFVHKLEQQAEQAGGKVHFLLGNHEVMAMTGDVRYINRKYRYTMASLKKNYEELFNEDTYLGRWLRSKPVAITIDKTAFVHAGFSEPLLEAGLSLKEMNEAFQEKILLMPEDSILADPLLNLLYNDYGPVWYRGYFDKEFTKWNAQIILSRLRKKRIVVGHTSFNELKPMFDGKIIGIDSSIKLGEQGEILFIEKKKLYRGTLNGDVTRLN